MIPLVVIGYSGFSSCSGFLGSPNVPLSAGVNITKDPLPLEGGKYRWCRLKQCEQIRLSVNLVLLSNVLLFAPAIRSSFVIPTVVEESLCYSYRFIVRPVVWNETSRFRMISTDLPSASLLVSQWDAPDDLSHLISFFSHCAFKQNKKDSSTSVGMTLMI